MEESSAGGLIMLEEDDKRLIEMQIPLEKLGDECRSEQYKSYGRLSNMHRWWAMRPLAASRVAAYASLIPFDEEHIDNDLEFIKKLAQWDNKHDLDLLNKAKERITDSNDGKPPKILDPFSGAGSMPLEAKRIGCEAHAVEYNPVAYLINLGVLSFPDLVDEPEKEKWSDSRIENSDFLKDLDKWGDWVFEKASRELEDVYGEKEIHHIWARTLPCQNPDCDLDIPLIKSFWLSDKDNHEAVYKIDCDNDGSIDVSIYEEQDIEIINENGKKKIKLREIDEILDNIEPTVRRGSVSCPACGSSFKAKKTRKLSKDIGFGNKLMVVVEEKEGVGKKYRLPNEKDFEKTRKAKEKLQNLDEKWVLDENLPPEGTLGIRVNLYEYNQWKQLFNTRQRLAIGTFAKIINEVYKEILEKKGDEDYTKAIVTYLGFALDKVAQYNCNLSSWQKGGEKANPLYRRSALPIAWDFVESNIIGEGNSGSFKAALDLLPRAIKTCSGTLGSSEVHLGDATNLPYDDETFDAVLTDPPYYDNVPYAALSDFFYVWLKRSLRDVYNKPFTTPLTPKSGEIIEDKGRHKKITDAEDFFEKKLTEAFSEINRVLKEDGITTIVFAHKSTEAWTQMIRSLLSSDLVVTATWPLHTEKRNRVRSMGSASLASSVYFVCRKKRTHETGYYSEVEEELNEELTNRLDYFWESGIRGADLLVSAIGPAVEIFGKYDEVKRLSGEEVPVSKWIEKTQRIVSDYALSKVLEGDVELGAIDHETRFYILYRWAFANEKEDFDEVKKLAQVNDVNLDLLENLGIIETKRGDVKVIPAHKRNLDEPSKIPESNDLPLIEKIHRASILWKREERDKLKVFIEEYCPQEKFWRSVQAIAEALPNLEQGSDDDKKEKQMLHGLGNYAGQVEFEERLQTSIDEYGGE
ncbi:MAG: DUF1156 domain-containing protein [archaeon]